MGLYGGMEHLRSPAGATGGNQWQMRRARKPLKQTDPQLMATHGNGSRPHGKEGVDGSSPSEGSKNLLQIVGFGLWSICRVCFVRWVWIPLWILQTKNSLCGGQNRDDRAAGSVGLTEWRRVE